VEWLEDRQAPAVLTVTSLANTGPGSLREAIFHANGDSKDTIVFAPGLNHATITLTTSSNVLGFGQSAFEIVSTMTILGSGQTLQVQGGSNFRLFTVKAGGFLALHDLTLTGGHDTSGSDGGAIHNEGSLGVQNCLLWQNVTTNLGYGGAFYNASGAFATLINTTIVANQAIYGGGVYDYGGTVTLYNCTVTGNSVTSGNFGAGLRVTGGAGATMTLVNTIVAGNTGANDVAVSNAATLDVSRPNIIPTTIDSGGGSTIVPGGVIQADPLLGPLQDNGGFTRTMAPGPNSPALNAGTTQFGFALTDARGAVRDTPPDIGAYEVNHPLAPIGVPTDQYSLYGPHPSGSANEAYVKGLYHATFQRDPDSAGQSFWLGQLNSGAMAQPQMAQQFFNSDENRNAQVGFFYTYFLHRAPEAAGMAFWRQQLQSGAMDELQVMTGFILSPEYTGLTDTTGFLNTIYYGLLSRSPEAGGFTYWKGQLDSNALTRTQVLGSFLNSPEGLNRVISDFNGAYLGRLPSSTELSSWSGAVQQGRNSIDDVAVSVLGGGEFFSNAAAQTGP
jgi:hypothetical protein